MKRISNHRRNDRPRTKSKDRFTSYMRSSAGILACRQNVCATFPHVTEGLFHESKDRFTSYMRSSAGILACRQDVCATFPHVTEGLFHDSINLLQMKSLQKSKEIWLTEMNSRGNKTDEKFRERSIP
ncbi:MAG: hypothetical protein ONB43_17865 [candidate division KSB1 bacterium]|nr:hypothetical protein [candidate division KSB1 bacterium]MDZ7407453.1 hypothetical protein [candidate division KSB1 bacterium]